MLYDLFDALRMERFRALLHLCYRPVRLAALV